MVKLPHVSGAEVVKTLETLGFAVARQRGSHIVMRRGAAGCVVPNHREIKTSTLIGILKQAGVTAGALWGGIAESVSRRMVLSTVKSSLPRDSL